MTEKALSKLSHIKISLTEGINKFQSLITYIKNNSNNITNYEERYTQGLTITSNVAESSVNNLINERQKHDGRMQWSRDGADNVLQIRSSIQSNNWQKDWNDVKSKIYRKAA